MSYRLFLTALVIASCWTSGVGASLPSSLHDLDLHHEAAPKELWLPEA